MEFASEFVGKITSARVVGLTKGRSARDHSDQHNVQCDLPGLGFDPIVEKQIKDRASRDKVFECMQSLLGR